MSLPVPHPGSRPTAFVFPFAEARAALAAIEDELDELAACASAHDAAAAAACQGFEGVSRDRFERGLGVALTDLAGVRRQLAEDAEELRGLLAEGEQARRDRDQAIRDWDARKRAYDLDQTERRREQLAR